MLIVCKVSSPLLIYGTHSTPDKIHVLVVQGSSSNLEFILYVVNDLKTWLMALCL